MHLTPEGRALFIASKKYIMGTPWEKCIFPGPKTREQIETEKLFDKVWETWTKNIDLGKCNVKS